MKKGKREALEQVAKRFGSRLVATVKQPDEAYEKHAEARDARVAKVLAEHLAKRKQPH